MENLFNEILEKDEKVIKVIKPNKGRYLKQYYWLLYIPFFWIHFILIMIGTFFTLPHFLRKGYKNVYYAYTNKRLIIRSGIFGNNYDSLDYKDITSTSVNVGFWDRKYKTGSLIFVSPSSHHEHPMNFAHIENPYQQMNEIKEYMNSIKK